MSKKSEVPGVAELLSLAGKTALVTGASGNIGRATAGRLAEAGAVVVAHYSSDRESADKLAAEIASAGGRCETIQADLAETANVDAMFRSLDDRDLRVDCVVNNAARQPVKAFRDIDADDWRSMMATNLDAPFAIIRSAAARMERQGRGGAIVNVASIEGIDPAIGHAHYATSKAGLSMLTRAAALELGGAGVRVNVVCPGLIMHDGLDEEWPDGVARWEARAPLSRLGTGSDVADAVLFLLSPAARWISGATLLVDGGMSAVSRW